MSDRPLSEAELTNLRDGNRQREPCGGCGAVPVHRPNDPIPWHYFHVDSCPVFGIHRDRERDEG